MPTCPDPSVVPPEISARKPPFLYWGLGLTLLGFTMPFLKAAPFLGAAISLKTTLLWDGLAEILSIMGLGLYAYARGYSPLWGLLGALPIVGPIGGLLWLSMTNPKPPAQKPVNPMRNLARELAGIGGYLIGMGFTYLATQDWLQDVLARIVLDSASEEWHPSLNVCLHMSPFSPGATLILLVVFLYRLSSTLIRSRTLDSFLWLIPRAFLVSVTVWLFVSTYTTISEARKLLDARVHSLLSQFRVGLSKNSVEALLLEANLAILREPGVGFLRGTSQDENQNYRVVQEGLISVRQGMSLMKLKFEDRLVAPSLCLFKLDRAESSQERQVFRRWYYMIDAHTRYNLTVEYDQQEALRSAIYVRRQYSDEAVVSCSVQLTVPASKDQPFPIPCPTDSKE